MERLLGRSKAREGGCAERWSMGGLVFPPAEASSTNQTVSSVLNSRSTKITP